MSVLVDKFLFILSFQLDGRVKTLHPSIHGGIMARRDQDHHMEALDKHGIGKQKFTFWIQSNTFGISYLFYDGNH